MHSFFSADSVDIQALAIRGDRIIAVGSVENVFKLKGPRTNLVDLTDKFVMPGIIEGHGHFQALGRSLIEPNLILTTTYDEALGMIEKAREFTPKGQWISGRGWHQEKWKSLPEGAVDGYPTHQALSAITPEHPR